MVLAAYNNLVATKIRQLSMNMINKKITVIYNKYIAK